MIKPKQTSHVNVIGAGFAGIECALFLARRGIRVHVFNSASSVYECDELTCDFHIKDNPWRERLKSELKILNSKLVDEDIKLRAMADSCPAEKVIEYGIDLLKEHPYVDYFDICINEINPKEVNVIATGPRTEGGLYEWLRNEFGSIRCFNQYPIYPLVDSVKEELCKKRKYDENHLYIPLNYSQYITFCNCIITQRNMYSKLIGFKPCDIDTDCVERHIEKNKDALRNSFMQPILLEDLEEKPYAVLKLNKTSEGYVIEGFCSNLPIDYQARIIHSLPQLAHSCVLRAGKPTPNMYINAPMVINHYGQAEKKDNLFFAGNISGIFGHLEGMYSGLYVGHNVYNYIKGRRMQDVPEESCIGLIMKQLMAQSVVKFVPIVGNYGIIDLNNAEQSRIKLKKYEEDFNGRDV